MTSTKTPWRHLRLACAAPQPKASMTMNNTTDNISSSSDDSSALRPSKRHKLVENDTQNQQQQERGYLISSSSSSSSSSIASSYRDNNCSSTSLDQIISTTVSSSSVAASSSADNDNTDNIIRNNEDCSNYSLLHNCISKLFYPLSSTLLPDDSATTNKSSSAAQPNTNKAAEAGQRNTNTSSNGAAVSNFRNIWMTHKFRTSLVSSPKVGVTVYLDSCNDDNNTTDSNNANNRQNDNRQNDNGQEEISQYKVAITEGRKYLQICIGKHTYQNQLEQLYINCIKDIYCFKILLNLLHDKKFNVVNVEEEEEDKCGEGMENDRGKWCYDVVIEWEEELDAALLLLQSQSDNNNSNNSIGVSSSSSVSSGNSKGGGEEYLSRFQQLSNQVPMLLSNLITNLTNNNKKKNNSSQQRQSTLRADQLINEYKRIEYENSTLANACLQRWLLALPLSSSSTSSLSKYQYNIDQIYFKFSPPGGRYLSKYERITFYFKDDASSLDNSKVVLMPCLTRILNRHVDTTTTAATTTATTTMIRSSHPVDAVVQDMIQTTWDALMESGYYIDQKRKDELAPCLSKFYTSGIVGGDSSNNNIPLLLNAHFTPTYPLSLYLYGQAGSGKSSLLRHLHTAIQTAISQHCDPELSVRFVKQNLNKSYDTLELELELRPNNNDYSVMSIIQGRRKMKMSSSSSSQSKSGLVVVGLEEMPSSGVEGNDPRQYDVCNLLSYRFSGRKGDLKKETSSFSGGGGRKSGTAAPPRNSSQRGISGDASIISIFTSNYELDSASLATLSKLEMFQNLKVIKIEAVSFYDRRAFASSYLNKRVRESIDIECSSSSSRSWNINLDIDCGEGDTRPLVRYLRMLSFYIRALLLKEQQQQRVHDVCSVDISVTQGISSNLIRLTNNQNGDSMHLKCGSFQNIYAVTPCTLDRRTSDVIDELQRRHPNLATDSSELSQILDFYFGRTLTPAVILSRNKELISDLTAAIARLDGVKTIRNIDPNNYKIMRSLYDPIYTPNLRDDILELQRNVSGRSSLVTIELRCSTSDSQMMIREIIEDNPSMTAFSSERSALYKEGLLFCVYVKGDITPEIVSRASLVI